MKRVYSSAILYSLFFVTTMKAQIIGDCNAPYDNATALVNLLVNGVPFSNATLNGFDCSAGYFDGSDANIGIESGVVMATGGVEAIVPGGFGGAGGGGVFIVPAGGVGVGVVPPAPVAAATAPTTPGCCQ